ncbi:MAG: amino acid permease [Methanomassiliicoccus sp.]|nr:amino acid permease [Methanomassiliicoccus sp.]
MTDEQTVRTSEVEVTLSRDLGLAEVLMIGLGPNIGSTIFLLIGAATGIAGPAIILALILNFFVTLTTAASYAELSSAFPETGGGYLWIKEGLFPPFGFLGGWMSWVGHCVACAVYALGFGLGVELLMTQYGLGFFGLDPATVQKLFAVIIAVAFCYMNYRGVKGAGRSELLVSTFLIGIIVLYCAFAVAWLLGDPAPVSDSFTPFLPNGYLSIAVSMAFTFMIFEGYEVVAQTGEEAKDPHRTVPRAMYLCIIISTCLFLAVTVFTIAVMGWEVVAAGNEHAIAQTADRIVPVLGAALISLGMVVGSVAAVNSIIFSTSRVSFSMGRDGNLPPAFGKLHPKNHTPVMAIVVSGIIIIMMLLFLDITRVATFADVLILMLFILVNVAALRLRRKKPEAFKDYLTPFFPVLPLVAIAAKMFLAISIFSYDVVAWYLALAVIFAGLLVHYFVKGKEEIERYLPPAPSVLSEEAKARYRVLIPVDDPRNEGLIDLAVTLTAKYDGEILLTNVVEVPNSVPLSAVEKKRVDERKKVLQKLQEYAELRGIKTRAIVLVSHDVVASIIDAAKEHHVNAIIVGWKGYTNTQKRVLGRKLDDIVRQTPCDIMVLKAEGKLRLDKIMVLSGGLWHVSKATEVAADIAQMNDSRVTILNVIVNERYLVRAAEYSRRLKMIVESRNVPVIVKEIHPENLVGGVVAESLETNLLVIGSSAVKRWDQFAFGAIQDVIAKNAKCPVLVYRRVAPGTPDAPGAILEEE